VNKKEKITEKIYAKQHKTYFKSDAFKRFLKVYENPKTFGLTKKDFYNKKVLDLGCGSTGYLQKAMENLKCLSVTCSSLGTKYILDLKKFEKKNINKKNFLIYKSQNIKKLSFKSKTFDIVFLNGVIMHLQNLDDIKKSLLEAQRVVKKNGYIWIYAGIENNNSVVDNYLVPSFREAYKKNHDFRYFVDSLGKKTVENFLKFYKKISNKKEFLIFRNFLKKYITLETLTFIQNIFQVPSHMHLKISFEFLKKTLKKCKIKKTQPLKFKRTDIRQFLQPLHGSRDKIAKIFYSNHLHVLAKKIR